MKSDRRHELQQNELAAYLGRINQSIEPYSRAIAVVVGTVVVAAIAYGLYSSKTSGDRSDATLQLILSANSGDADVLATVGDSYPQTAAGAWSRLYEGDQYLSEGLRSLYLNRDEAQSQLDEARTAYRSALASGDDRLMRSRAHFGLARAAESLGEIDEAIASYGECIAVNESKAMVELAQQRIDAISNPNTKEFLAWFSDQDFSPADPSLPPSLPSGVTLPDLPDLNLPELGDDTLELKNGGITMPKEGDDSSTKTEAADAKPSESDADSNSDADAKQDDAKQDDAKQDDAKQDDAASESDPAESDDAPEKSGDDSPQDDNDSAAEPATDDPS